MTLELAYDEFGAAGPPVVILHGLLGSARNWTSIGRQLAETHRVFALDLRNHGRSPWAETMTFDEMAGDVAAFIERHDLCPATLVGHSLGGKVAMRLALIRPDLVERLMVVDVAPVAYSHSFASYIDALRQVDLSLVIRRAHAESLLEGAIPDAGVRSFLLQNLVKTADAFAWRVNLEGLRANMTGLMGFPADVATPYAGPTLVLSGGRSDYVRPEHRPLIDRLFPQAGHTVVKDAGHWVHAERPSEFLAQLRQFLS